MAERNYVDMLDARAEQGMHLSVGIDINWDLVHGQGDLTLDKLLAYGKMVMDETADIAACFKPNHWYWAQYRNIGGIDALADLSEYGRINHPDVPQNLDVKEADIGRTNQAALNYVFDDMGFDAMTIQPWMGMVGMEPHLAERYKHKGLYVIAKTSNDGSSEFQDLPVPESINLDEFFSSSISPDAEEHWRGRFISGEMSLGQLHDIGVIEGDLRDIRLRPLWQVVLKNVTSPDGWNKHGNVGAVIGATYVADAQSARGLSGEAMILSPGLGTQGGEVVDMRNSRGSGVVYNASSGIMLPEEAELAKDDDVRATVKRLAIATNNRISEALDLAA